MFSLIWSIGTCPGPSIITCSPAPRRSRQLAERVELRELRLVVGVGGAARAQPVAEGERDVVGLHDLADLVEVRVEEAFLVVRQAPLGHDRAAARHDPGDALRRQRDVAQQHAGVDREVVDALLGLLDEGVAADLRRQVLGLPATFSSAW